MMTIVMYCDRCGEEIDPSVQGGVRVRTGNREYALHLCARHQHDLRELIVDFCQEGSVREVKQPSLGRE